MLISLLGKRLRLRLRRVASDFVMLPKSVLPVSGAGEVVMLFHQLDLSGAPLIGAEIAEELHRQGRKPTVVSPKIVRPDVNEDFLAGRLLNQGVKVLRRSASVRINLRGVGLIFINSSAIPKPWLHQALRALSKRKPPVVVMFIHENEAGIYLSKPNAEVIVKAQKLGLRVFVPSKQAQQKLQALYDLGIHAEIQTYSVRGAGAVSIEGKTASLEVVVVGSSAERRKRQLETVIAVGMAQALNGKLDADSAIEHRPINLTLIGIGDDELGNEIKAVGAQVLTPDSLRVFGPLSPEGCLEILSKQNVAFSLSENESFGLYLAETMTGGAVVLRTPVGGHDEMVIEGVNGYLLTNGISDAVKYLTRLSDQTITTDARLVEMMGASIALMQPQTERGYRDFVAGL